MTPTHLSPNEVRAQMDLPPDEDRNLERAELGAQRQIREPLVYRRDERDIPKNERRSFFADLAFAADENPDASERLDRHQRQMADVTFEKRGELEGAEYEYRVNPNLSTGTGGEFAPPLWWNEMFATTKRPSEILQRLAPVFDLPEGVSSVNLPRITQGTRTYQTTAGTPIDDRDVETETSTSNVSTFAGMSDWSLQALEQSPKGAHLDWAVGKDLTEGLDSQVEFEMIIGTGTNERLRGLTEISGINTITYTSATPAATAMWPFVGQALAQIGVKRLKPPEALMMTTPRFFWLASSADSQNRPLLLEDYPHSDFPNAGLMSVGVYFNDVIGKAIGGASLERDTIIACRPSDMAIMRGQPKVTTMLDVLSGTLQARFRLHRAIAALLGRYPSGISQVSGTGMKVQEGFK